MTTFYLGVPPAWLHRSEFAGIPMFVSNRPLSRLRRLSRALGPVAVDSGGFSELSEHGSWDHGPTPRRYAAQVARYRDDIGIRWAAPQDWMCEPWIVAKTGLSVVEHQRRTIGSYLDLKGIDATLPIAPVIQGWQIADYERHIAMYEQAGVDLRAQPIVGIGSVCRRQGTREAAELVTRIADHGIALHGFGFKIDGLREVGDRFASADSMAWAYAGRRERAGCDYRSPGSRGPHKNEANCPRYALAWRRKALAALATPRARQLTFDALALDALRTLTPAQQAAKAAELRALTATTAEETDRA
ncbi:DUF7221 family queuine tRNA-ribosyltransferase-like protein [Streptomyces hoynatensis]|uniref:deazapurine DNA modification protein DpdA family protein n=1 Tax=Streptomyces hoynatensis TaxID=1141874 RepID=UPI0018816FDE|nr:hypothetical protein [Streptomyces hoynatensis]